MSANALEFCEMYNDHMNSTTITLPPLSFTQLDKLTARVPLTLRAFPTPEGTELRATVKLEDVARLRAAVDQLIAGGF